jgi:hypothetical protein
MIYLFWALWGVGTVLQILVIAVLLRGQHYRKFPLVFLFVIVLFLTSVADASAFLEIGQWTNVSRKYFWLNEVIRQSMMFAVVISLVIRALAGTALMWLRKWLLGGAVLFAILSMLLTSDANLDRWMTTVVRNLSACAVVLNMALWLALVRRKSPDRKLFLISGGLGLQMAGDAIGYSLRQIAFNAGSRSLIEVGNLVAVLAHLLYLYVWWQAFRKPDTEPDLTAQAKTAV